QAAYADQVKPAVSAMADNLDAIEAAAADRFADQAAAASSAKQTSIVVIFLVLGLGLVAAVALGLYASGAVTKPLQRVKRALDGMANHDLTVECVVTSTDEVGQMATSLASAQGNVRALVAAVADSVQAVASSSEELSASGVQ